MSDLIPSEGATQEQIDAFVASLCQDAGEHVRQLLVVGAPAVISPSTSPVLSVVGGRQFRLMEGSCEQETQAVTDLSENGRAAQSSA